MKAEMKAVVASIVVIALALTAVSGITYSWFSDTEKSTIDVSTATININGGYTDTPEVKDSNNTPLTSDDNDTTATLSMDKKDITISNLVGERTITATYELTNSSTVDTKYRMYVMVEGVTDDLASKMIFIKGGSDNLARPEDGKISFTNGVGYAIGSATEGKDLAKTSYEYNFTVIISSVGVTLTQSTSFSIKIVNEAYQSDYTFTGVQVINSETGQATISSGNSGKDTTVRGTIPVNNGTSDESANIVVDISAGAMRTATDNGQNNVTLETKIEKNDDSSHTLSIGFTDSDVTNFGTDKVTVTVTVPGTDANLTVVYLGTGLSQPTDITKKTVGDNTEITFTTTHFSDFMIISEGVVAIKDNSATVYDTLSEAVKTDASKIFVISNTNESSAIEIKNAVTIEGNNHTIRTSSENGISISITDAIDVSISNLTLEDTLADGKSYGIRSGDNNHVKLTLDNVSVTGYNTKGTYITGANYVKIVGGIYKDNATNTENIVNDVALDKSQAFLGGDHSLQIDIKKDHSDVTIYIEGVTFDGYNGILSPICISQRSGEDKDATSAYIGNVIITGCKFNGVTPILGDISIGTTPKTSEAKDGKIAFVQDEKNDNMYIKIGNQAFDLGITACGEKTVVCYRGGTASENISSTTADASPLKITLSDGSKVTSKGGETFTDYNLIIAVSKDAVIDGDVKAREIVIINTDESTSGTYSVEGTNYATLLDAISAAGNSPITVLSNVSDVSSVIIGKDAEVNLTFADNVAMTSTADYLFTVEGGLLGVKGGTLNTVSPFIGTNGALITITDTTINNTAYAKVGVKDSAYSFKDHVVLKNVTMTSTGSACLVGFKNAQVDVINGTYTSNFGTLFATNGSNGINGQGWYFENAHFNVSMSGATGEDKDCLSDAIQCHNGGVWYFEKCFFDVKDGVAISVRGGEVTINDCTFTVDKANPTSGKLNYTDPKIKVDSGNAIAVSYNSNGSYGYNSEVSSLTITVGEVAEDTSKITSDGTVYYFNPENPKAA